MNRLIFAGAPLLGSFLLAGSLWIFSTKTSYQNPELSHLSDKLQDSIEKLILIKSEQIQYANNNSAYFWENVSDAYLWLKGQNNLDRYIYLFSLSEALATEDKSQRQIALKNWFNNESSRVRASLISQANILKWNQYSNRVSSSLSKMLGSENTMRPINNENRILISSLTKNLEEMKREISAIKPQSQVFQTTDHGALRIAIIILGFFGSLTAFLIGKRDNNKNNVDTAVNKIEAFDLLPNKEVKTTLDFESLCLERINDLNYLFSSAGLRVHNTSSSTSFFRINGNKEKLTSACDALIKGSLALAHNQPDSNSISLQWSCKTTEERAFFDIEILGKKFNQEELRKNHILLNGNSIISQFAKAEKQLENYRPVIQIIPQDNRTKISMSLEIAPMTTSVIQVH